MKRMWTVLALIAMLTTSVGVAAAPAFGSGAAGQGEKVAVFIAFARQPGPAEEALVRRAGGTIKYTYRLVPAIAASLPEAAINGLLANPNVTSVEPDGEVWAIDAELDNTWGVKNIGAGTVHDGGNKGTGVKIAVIDTGIDSTHLDLNANFAGGYDFVNGDTDPADDNGHGTHVAGTVGAEDDNAGVVGVAPEASLYALKVLSASGGGSWSDIIAALQWAVNNGIQVTNNSYGSSLNPGGTVKAAFDNSAAAGILHVAAAGNSGNLKGKGNNVGYPARFDSVIAVAATDANDNRAKFSSTGAAVELAAPGVNINSTQLGGGYVEFNGTSMASPHVAGTAALVIAAGITDANNDGNINDEVRQRLQETADDLGDPGRDAQYGYGLVDADEAAAPSDPDTTAPFISNVASGNFNDTSADITWDTDEASDSVVNYGITTTLGSSASIADLVTGHLVGLSGLTADTLYYYEVQSTDSSGNTATNYNGGGYYSFTTAAASSPDTATTVSVNSIDYATEGGKAKDKHLLITVALLDDLGNEVAGASVSIDLIRDDSFVASGTGTTGTDGTVTFSLKNAPSGTYTTEVTEVTADGLNWDAVTPPNQFNKQ